MPTSVLSPLDVSLAVTDSETAGVFGPGATLEAVGFFADTPDTFGPGATLESPGFFAEMPESFDPD